MLEIGEFKEGSICGLNSEFGGMAACICSCGEELLDGMKEFIVFSCGCTMLVAGLAWCCSECN